MALTPDQEAIVKAKIRSLYEDIGNLTMAKQQVYPLDDLDDMDDINSDQYDEYSTEISYWEDQYKYLVGRMVLASELVTPSMIEQAAEGSGDFFPTERLSVCSTRSTGTGNNSKLVDYDSVFKWTNKWRTVDIVKPGDIMVTSGTDYTVVSVDDEHTLTVGGVLGTGITYKIERSLIGSAYTLLRPYLLDGIYGGTGFYSDCELHLMNASNSYRDTGETSSSSNQFTDNTNLFYASDVGEVIHIRTGPDAGYYNITSLVDSHNVLLDTMMTTTSSGLEYSIGNSSYQSEIGVLEWFENYWSTHPSFIPSFPSPLYNLYSNNIDKLNDLIEDETLAVSTNKTAYDSYSGDYEDSGAGAIMTAAKNNLDNTKNTLDYDGSGTITIADFVAAAGAGDESVIKNAISDRKDFINNTRVDDIDDRKEYIETVLGEILDDGSGVLDSTDERFVGAPTGDPMLYYKRFNYLDMRVNRADGTYKGIKSREVDTTNIDNMIAAKERQIDEYEALL